MLEILASYHCLQFMENGRTILEKMAKNLLLDPALAQTQAANFLFKKYGFIIH